VDDQRLPYSDQVNELGTLAKGFNDLLSETRKQLRREHAEELQRKAVEEKRRAEEIRIREANLQVIGHEIRSPLQALISLNEKGTKNRHYIDRILDALPHLQGSLRPEDALSSRALFMEKIDLAEFLRAVVANVQLEEILNVNYRGPVAGIFCFIDDGAFEDCVGHLLANADRFRAHGSPIEIAIAHDDASATICVANEGPAVSEADKERIFGYGFSTTQNQEGVGSGIGLFVVRQYLSRMHGTIDVSNTASGVVFCINLPLSSSVKSL
jgi:signal transduction histidine kinase